MKSVEALDHIVGTVQLLQDIDDIKTGELDTKEQK
jgi:hypothetical protein